MPDELGAAQNYNPASEAAVLSAVLNCGRRAIDALADVGFDPADFYAPKHEAIFRAALALDAKGDPVEASSVATKLGQELEKVGGYGYVFTLYQTPMSPASAVFHAKTVTEYAALRRLVAAGTRIVQIGSARDGGDAAQIVDAAQAEVAAVAASLHGGGCDDDHDMGPALDDLLERIETGGPRATPTGVSELDRLLVGGLQVGTVTTVAARPGVGKTALGLQVALNMAINAGRSVGYTTLEMTQQDLLLRAVAALEKVDYGRLQKSPDLDEPLTEAEWRALRRGTEKIRDSKLLISKRTKASVPAVCSDIRAMVRRRGDCSVWVIDYLGLVTPTDVRVIREQQVAGITRMLKQAALETGVPIVLLCQLNREGEKTGRPPVLTDRRESGAIEQDSDNVILLHRDQENRPDVLAVRVAKNRRGPISDFVLTFEGSYQRVSEPAWSPSRHLGVAR